MLLIICPGRVTDSLNQAHGTPAGLQVMLLILRHLPDWIEAAAGIGTVTGCWAMDGGKSRLEGLPGSHGLVGIHHAWVRDSTEQCLDLSRSACISVKKFLVAKLAALHQSGINTIHAG